LAAYEAWGMDCVNKFNGMWAFVIYDTTQNKLVGSRDRFGVKPFYYIHTKEVFAFASEQKALLASELIKPKLNHAAVFDYFVFSKMEGEEEGMFAGIFELQQAHNFEFYIADKILNKWKYYTLPYLNSFETYSEIRSQELTQKTKELIFESVRLRLRSDVAVGSCLSGGIDSSSIVSIMNELLKENPAKINLFTSSFSNPKLDEGKWAKLIVDNTNSDWSRCYPSGEELKNDLTNLTYSQDLPIWSTSTYAQYRVMQLAKEKGVKVILDGQGGDELWAGYPHHQALFLRELIANKNWKEAQKLLSNAGIFPSNALWFGKQYFKHSGLAMLPDNLTTLVYKNYFKHIQFLNPDFISTYQDRIKTHFESSPKTVNEILHKETTAGLLKGYLKCEDRCSMWHSVESRTPFADDKNLIELAFQTPSVYKIHLNQSKYILRKAMTDVVPDAILGRQDKMGYSTPNAQWINEIKESVRSDFDDSLAQILDVKKIQNNYHKLFNSDAIEDNGQTFKFISFALWYKIFKLKINAFID
jgi:asparagine synthase (glutamine-hydrolysing)